MSNYDYERDLAASEQAWEQREARDLREAFEDDKEFDREERRQVENIWITAILIAIIVAIANAYWWL